MPVREAIVDDLLDHALDPGRSGIGEGFGRGLHLVGQEHQTGFPGLGAGAGIAEVIHVHLLARGRLGLGLMIEVADKAAAVVLLDNINDLVPQVVFPGQIHPVLDMGDEDQGAQRWGQFFVFILPA